jgi:hypothetical protein
MTELQKSALKLEISRLEQSIAKKRRKLSKHPQLTDLEVRMEELKYILAFRQKQLKASNEPTEGFNVDRSGLERQEF